MDNEDTRNLSLGKVPPKGKKSHQILGIKQVSSCTLLMSGESQRILAYTRQASSWHRPTNQALINIKVAKDFQLRLHSSFHLAPMSASFLLVNQQSLADIIRYAKHLGDQLVLEKSVRPSHLSLSFTLWWYHYSNPSWSAGLKISPRYNGKRRQVVNFLQAFKPDENRTRHRMVRQISALALGRTGSPSVSLEPSENHHA